MPVIQPEGKVQPEQAGRLNLRNQSMDFFGLIINKINQ
jgi:hypothetical protein